MATAVITKGELHGSPPPQTMNPRASLSGVSSAPLQKSKLPTAIATAPRVDVEPIYTQLKGMIGENWQLYKQTVAEFVIGKRNQSEMGWIIDPFVKGDSQRESLHNQFILAIFTNAQREPPEMPGLATWVAANDKPTTQSKPVTGDAAEQKLKSEVMQLPARERHRLKALLEDTTDGFTQQMQNDFNSLQISLPDPQTASGGALTRTNWEGEIQKRYTQQLYVESNEFPDADSIKARMLPICYEEGIFHGFAQGTPDFMNIATEMYIKDMLARLFASTRSNGPHWVKTAQYKRRMLREEQAWRKGEIRKSATGQLPIEQEQERNRTPLSLPDLRLALDIGGTPWGTHTPRAMRMFEATGVYDELAARERETSRGPSQGKMAGSMLAPPKPLTNGVLPNGVHTNGVHHEEEESGWLGGNDTDRMELDRVLDDCLAGI